MSAGSSNSPPKLSAREVCQIVRDVILGRRMMAKACAQTWDEIYVGLFIVNIEGWCITIFNDCDELDYCDEALSPDGRRWSFNSGDRFGTDPIALLSTWEHENLHRMLKAL
ncbi:DUF7693 family protein [Pseudomonas syringae]|uniref:DUF7693 family protein n=1 Tax=Pseudomonas syringae TaxID=317 RepID=UPI003BB80BE4